jgi:F-type H+-transporting ATPase subunit b
MAQTTTETTAEGATAHTTATTGAEGGEHGGGSFPPLDTSTFPSQLFWLIIFFAALYLLMSRFALPRLGRILANRKDRIDGDLARAHALKEETEAAVKSYEKALADARAKANDIARDTRDAVTKAVDAEQHKLDDALAAKIAEAEARIAKAKAKGMTAVAEIAAESAADIVAALGGGKVTKVAVAKALAAVKG